MATDKEEALRKHLSAGQLVDFQWRLGVIMSSENCRNLNTPYVTLAMTVEEPNGQLQKCSLELSIPEFQKFHSQVKEISTALATI